MKFFFRSEQTKNKQKERTSNHLHDLLIDILHVVSLHEVGAQQLVDRLAHKRIELTLLLFIN